MMGLQSRETCSINRKNDHNYGIFDHRKKPRLLLLLLLLLVEVLVAVVVV